MKKQRKILGIVDSSEVLGLDSRITLSCNENNFGHSATIDIVNKNKDEYLAGVVIIKGGNQTAGKGEVTPFCGYISLSTKDIPGKELLIPYKILNSDYHYPGLHSSIASRPNIGLKEDEIDTPDYFKETRNTSPEEINRFRCIALFDVSKDFFRSSKGSASGFVPSDNVDIVELSLKGINEKMDLLAASGATSKETAEKFKLAIQAAFNLKIENIKELASGPEKFIGTKESTREL